MEHLKTIFASKEAVRSAGEAFINCLLNEVEFKMYDKKYIVTVDEEYMTNLHQYMVTRDLKQRDQYSKVGVCLRSEKKKAFGL